jgi:hypothetical protein
MILTLDQCVDITWTKGEPPRGVFRRRVLDEKEGIVVEAEVTRLVPNLSHLERSVVTCQMPRDNAVKLVSLGNHPYKIVLLCGSIYA